MLLLGNYGLIVVSFFVWLIALVTGRLPDSLHQALAAIARYQFRFNGYAYLVTAEYPWWGLFGDGPAETSAAAPADSEVGIGPVVADPWRLSLSGAARGLVSGVLGIGLVAYAVVAIVVPSANNNPVTAVSNAAGLIHVGEAYNKLTSSTTNFEAAAQACSVISCETAQDRKEAGYLQAFASAVRSAGVHGQAATDASKLISDANASAESLDHLATATSVAQYQTDVAASALQQQLDSVDADYLKVVHDLAGS